MPGTAELPIAFLNQPGKAPPPPSPITLAEQPFALDSDLTRFCRYLDALHFLRVAELFDDDAFLFDITWHQSLKGRLPRQPPLFA